MITYRKLTTNDTEWLTRITETFRHQHIDEQKANSILSDEHVWVYLANEEEKVCGYILAYEMPRIDLGKNMLMIYHCFVQEQYRRKHVAKTLMKSVLKACEEKQIHYTFLITQEDNHAANALYQNLGGELHPDNRNVYYWYGSGKPQV